MRRQLALITIVLGSCVGCDQVSKQAALRWLREAPPSSFLGDTVRLTYLENRGAFLGMGADWSEFSRWLAFSLAATVLVLGALAFTIRHLSQLPPASRWFDRDRAPALGALLLAAGGIGNLIDRFTRDGAVVDFMNVGLGSLRTGVFNVADVQIMAGVAVMMLFSRSGHWPPASAHPR